MRRMMAICKFKFDAAHKLPNYNGKCANLHGHTYSVEYGVERIFPAKGYVDSKTGMVVDFTFLKNHVQKNIEERLDHAYLNDIVFNPTAEKLAEWLVSFIQGILYSQSDDLRLTYVQVWETEGNSIRLEVEGE